jgi:hypothetical protein
MKSILQLSHSDGPLFPSKEPTPWKPKHDPIMETIRGLQQT